MNVLTIDDFPPGAEFEVPTGGAPVTLSVREAEALPESGRTGGSFRVEFVGPGEMLLPQATHALRRNGGEDLEIFLVPIGRGADGLRYEAIFF